MKRTQSTIQPQHSLLPHVRWIVALAVGVPCVVLAAGAFYSLSGIRGGHYGETIFLAIVYSFLLWVIFRIGRCDLMPAAIVWPTLIGAAIGPLVIGHAIGYGDLQSLPYRLVQEDATGQYPAAWKQLGREELFPIWVGSITGEEGGGVWGYLRAQAAIGWEGWEGIRFRIHAERTGVWVWLAWLFHLTLFLAAGAIAFFAAKKDEPAAASEPGAKSTFAVSRTGEQEIEREKGGPVDLPAATAWSDYNDQQDILVSYRYEPRTGFPSLREFFVARVRQSFSRSDGKYVESDVRNYLERVCVMKQLSRSELARFISQHSGPTIRGRTPKVPENLRSAIICRDEPSTKEVIWETDKGYWAMAWTKGGRFSS